MVEKIKKVIEAVEALGLIEGDEICLSLIKKVINKHVTFLDWKQREIITRLPTIGRWEMVYRKNRGEGYIDFEKWLVVDSKTLHDFIMENCDADDKRGLRLGEAWFNIPKPLTVIAIKRDSFHHAPATRRKIALARLRFVEDWLAKN